MAFLYEAVYVGPRTSTGWVAVGRCIIEMFYSQYSQWEMCLSARQLEGKIAPSILIKAFVSLPPGPTFGAFHGKQESKVPHKFH